MTLEVRPAAKGDRTPREAIANSPRPLLLLGALLIMIFVWSTPGNTSTRLGALLGATAAAWLALFKPMAIRSAHLLSRIEWALLALLLLTGLVLTAGRVALAIAGPPSPLWYGVTLGYTALGLVGALAGARRLPQLKWAFPLFVLAHSVLVVTFLRAMPVGIDVYVFLRDGAGGLLRAENPYSMTFPNVYSPAMTELFYGEGVVVNGRVTYGFPYLPLSLLVAIPGHLFGDVRYAQLTAMVLTALALRRLATDRVGGAAAVLGIAAPSAILVLTRAWTEPTLVALLACLVLAFERRRYAFAAGFLGLFLVSKQYVLITIPVLWLIRQWLTRRVLLVGLSLGAAVTLPFFLVNPAAFWRAVVEFQLIQPFRTDSVSLLVSSVNAFGWPPSWTYAVLPLVGGGLTAIALAFRAPRTPAAFAAGLGLTLLVTILLSKQAFLNYYFFVSGAFLIAAVAWPTQRRSTHEPTERS